MIDFIVLEYTDIQYLSLIMIFVAVEVVVAVSDTFFPIRCSGDTRMPDLRW